MKHPAAAVAVLFLMLNGAGLHAQGQLDPLVDAVQMMEARRFAEARPILLQLAAGNPDNAAAAYWAGRALLELGEDEPAAKQLERAVKLQPASADYLLWLGRAYGSQAQRASTLRQPGLARKTKSTFERVLALDPDNLDARSHLIDFHLVAPGILGGNKQTALQQAHEIRSRNVYRGNLELARVQLAMNQKATAEQTMQSVLRAFPDSASPRFTLALFYQNEERYDDAFRMLQPLAARVPVHRSALYQIGRLAAVSGRYLDEGEAGLRAYLKAAPSPSEQPLSAAHWRLGMIAEHRGDREGARREYEAALALNSGYAPARDALKKLK